MKDEMPHKLPVSPEIDEMLVNQGKQLIVIHREVTVWYRDGVYYLYSFANLERLSISYEEIMNYFNVYFNRRK